MVGYLTEGPQSGSPPNTRGLIPSSSLSSPQTGGGNTVLRTGQEGSAGRDPGTETPPGSAGI